MLYRLLVSSPASDYDLYRVIKNRDVGSPITVRVNEVDVCLDYFQALHEVKMILSCVDSSSDLRVIEIGPGYGRTCHAAISLIPEIGEYWMVDLEPSLVLARRYLSAVLSPQQLKRIRFVKAQELSGLVPEASFDLALNIDSFGDMPPTVVTGYLNFIAHNCTRFFCKNPLGKYLENPLSANSPNVVAALETGILQTILDIYDANAIEDAVPNFLAAYLPGKDWKVEAECMASPWSYYHQAVYRRNGS